MNEELKKELRLKIKELKKNPLLYMSLGSKELFHSNFWAWLFDLDKNFINIFFPEIDIQNECLEIKREEKNRDITVWVTDENNKKSAYVIENKIKSLPDEEQLKNYQEKLGKDFKKGVITGIVNPSFNNGWKFVSYDKISEKILNAVKKIKENLIQFNYNLIVEYCNFLKDLHSLLDNFIKFSETKKSLNYEEFEFSKEMSEIKMDNVCKKLNMQEFANYVNYNLSNVPYKDVFIETNFTRGESLIDIEFKKEYKEGFEISIGIQIQGTQYRKRIVKRLKEKIEDNNIKILNNEKLKREIFEDYKKKGWFENKNQDCLFGRKTSQRGDYCSYCVKNDYVSVYQYYNIGDFSFEENLKNIKTDLEKAKEILKLM